MQTPQRTNRTVLTYAGWALGGLGFLLSLVLAVAMLVVQGAPGFLLIWAVAFLATAACMRAHARWRRSIARMHLPARVFHPARKGWREEAEDIAFRDMPDAVFCK